jgi:hypothetical protein
MKNEEWKRIDDTDYFVSNMGRVKKEVFLKPHFDSNLILVRVEQSKASLARLVLTLFDGQKDRSYQVGYIDGDRTNCRLDNLFWMKSKRRNLKARKLTDEQVELLRYKALEKTYTELAREYDVEVSTISKIVRGETYKDVGGPRQNTSMSDATIKAKLKQSVFTKEDIVAIRKRAEAEPCDELAEEFGVNECTIRAIVNRRIWGSV